MSKRIVAVVILAITVGAVSYGYFGSRNVSRVSDLVRPLLKSPNDVLSVLKDGNARFVKGSRKFAHLSKGRLSETALAQEPFATILACSDSRVPVEHVFDAGIGDLFVIRVAGNVCSDHEIGSIEYGVEHLNTRLVVVLGHTHCGAVTAVVEQAHVRGKFPHLAEHIIPAHEDAMVEHPTDNVKAAIEETVRYNVQRGIQELLKTSEGIRSQVENGNIKVVGAVYDLLTGTVEWLPEPMGTNRLEPALILPAKFIDAPPTEE